MGFLWTVIVRRQGRLFLGSLPESKGAKPRSKVRNGNEVGQRMREMAPPRIVRAEKEQDQRGSPNAKCEELEAEIEAVATPLNDRREP